jgi:hypothetical protein
MNDPVPCTSLYLSYDKGLLFESPAEDFCQPGAIVTEGADYGTGL